MFVDIKFICIFFALYTYTRYKSAAKVQKIRQLYVEKLTEIIQNSAFLLNRLVKMALDRCNLLSNGNIRSVYYLE